MREFLALRRYGPADAETLDSEAVRTRLAAGQSAMDIDWADTGVLAGALAGKGSGESRIAGDVGFFALPGSREVWSPAKPAWDLLSAGNQIPHGTGRSYGEGPWSPW